MYAVFRAGGKQYRASKGEILRVEKVDADEGANIQFDEVLLVGEGSDIKVGSPLLAGTSVSATVLKQGKSKKVSVVKFRRRQNYLRQHTHRQFFTEVEITDIGKGKAPAKSGDDAPAAKKTAKKSAKKSAAKKPAAKKKPATKKVAAKKASSKKTAVKKKAKKKASKKTSK